MSAFRDGVISEKIDRATSILMQRNMCLVCHLPMCYGDIATDPLWNHTQYWWKKLVTRVNSAALVIQNNREAGVADLDRKDLSLETCTRRMRFRGDDTSDFSWGVGYWENNAEKCHLINSCMVYEISMFDFFEAPAVNTLNPNIVRRPDMNWYKGNNTIPPIINFDQNELDAMSFSDPAYGMPLDARMARLNDFLTTCGVHYFMACKCCNAAHTGVAGVRYLYRTHYGANHNDFNTLSVPNIMYSMLFDCMANRNANGIMRDSTKTITWHLETWLYYCSIMWLAQCTKNMTKIQDCRYYFKYSMREMGVLDFYMGQLIMGMLYARFSIPFSMNFVWHTTLCSLAHWAKQEGLLVSANDQHLLWRWVLGDVDGGVERPMAKYNEYVGTGQFWEWTGHMPQLLKDKLLLFNRTWIPAIGSALSGNPCPPGANLLEYGRLSAFVRSRANNIFYMNLKRVCSYVDGGGFTTVDRHIVNPTIRRVREAMVSVFGNPQYKQIMWENFGTLTIPRCKHWYEQLPDAVRTQEVRDLWLNFMRAAVAMANA